MCRRIPAAVLLLAMLLSVSASAVAPRWDSNARCSPNLTVSSKSATCWLYVETANTNDDIVAHIELTRDGDFLASWNYVRGSNGVLDFSETYSRSYTLPTGTYRMSYTVEVSGSGGTDTMEDYVEFEKYL